MGYAIGAFVTVWLLAVLFTFIQKAVTKKVTRRTIIITTIAAAVLVLIARLFSGVETADIWRTYLAVIIALPVVLTVRIARFNKKSKNIDTEAQGKNS